ncbi:hypothetical protein A1O3_06111 [Capronia epimyces CBS 606.96]|uniref:PPPDE domain-containing protein n=1 Tax=Capronia epimyces CBS 606.96 TaxID=1182542 RepID=W9XPZ7_9EURO|nr:uncharacterized protein A1O3_06111 [Capronia epimyces CBS 606.96]EXJ82298.1 hypothetical protein A1O3_06111 [Capronia epimyces CBS 606.96]
MATYNVYIAEYISMPIFHNLLYIEFEPGKGRMYHVTGGHNVGWQYETREKDKIDDSIQFYGKHPKGTIAGADLQKVDQICRTVPMPRNQVLYGVPRNKDCRHWVLDALAKMEQQGVFKPSK